MSTIRKMGQTMLEHLMMIVRYKVATNPSPHFIADVSENTDTPLGDSIFFILAPPGVADVDFKKVDRAVLYSEKPPMDVGKGNFLFAFVEMEEGVPVTPPDGILVANQMEFIQVANKIYIYLMTGKFESHQSEEEQMKVLTQLIVGDNTVQ